MADADSEGRFHLFLAFFGQPGDPAVTGLRVWPCADGEALVSAGSEGDSSAMAEALELSLVFGPSLSYRTENSQLFPGRISLFGIPESGVEGRDDDV